MPDEPQTRTLAWRVLLVLGALTLILAAVVAVRILPPFLRLPVLLFLLMVWFTRSTYLRALLRRMKRNA